MASRFSRRIRLIPGVLLNLSRSGVSASFGGRGAWHTVSKGSRRVAVGVPGTGLSYSQETRSGGALPANAHSAARGWVIALIIVAALVANSVRWRG